MVLLLTEVSWLPLRRSGPKLSQDQDSVYKIALMSHVVYKWEEGALQL